MTDQIPITETMLSVTSLTDRQVRDASLTLAGHASGADELAEWLECCGLRPYRSAGLFRRACAHEHVRDGWLCTGHAGTPQNGLCRTCWELPGDASHECPIGIAEVTT